GHSDVMNELAVYTDVARDSAAELAERLEALREAGVEDRFLVVDPGLGFSKTGEQNWEVLSRWELICGHGLPVLIGASRRRFVSTMGVDRDAATAAISAYSAEQGAWAVRVHEVPGSLAAVRVRDRLSRGRRGLQEAGRGRARSWIASRRPGSAAGVTTVAWRRRRSWARSSRPTSRCGCRPVRPAGPIVSPAP